MAATVWQQLGAFVQTGANLSDDSLKRFSEAGGRWYVPVIYGDNDSGPWNRNNFANLRTQAAKYRVKVGGWFNCFGGPIENDAQAIASIAKDKGINLVILDLEIAYQYPNPGTSLFQPLVSRVRELLPTAEIGVSSNGVDNAKAWNLFRKLKVRVLPQCYTWMMNQDTKTSPETIMKWIKENGTTDANLKYGKVSGLPLSYVHPTLEVTGVEGSDLASEIQHLKASKKYGFSYGWSIYTLENTPYSDFPLLAAERGKTFLV